MKINVIGLGYIGLPTALMFASKDFDVVGTDYNKKLIDTLNKGEVTFEEKGLKELYDDAVSKSIKFTSEYIKTDFYIVAVATPYDKFSKKVDASYVCAAVKEVLKVCDKGAIVVIESTVSPGTIEKYVYPIVEERGFVVDRDIFIVHAPERIIPGNMIYELMHNSRTIGANDERIGKIVADCYQKLTDGHVVVTDVKSAEMTKVVENTFRAVNIAFANELLKICESSNMDVYEIIRICNMHPRVNILNPGPGVGGHCISVDPWFLVGDYPSLTKVIWESMKVNDSMPEYVLNKTYEIAKKENITNIKRIGIYGLTYKENVDDFRESPTLQLLEHQQSHLAEPLKVYDPWIKDDIAENQYHDFDKFLNDVDMVIVMVKHNHIIENFDKLKGKIVLDTQNVLKGEKVYKL